MRILRTPDERFDDLTDFPYQPRYVTVPDELRMAYVEAGSADGEVWMNRLTGERLTVRGASLAVGQVLGHFPVSLLERQ